MAKDNPNVLDLTTEVTISYISDNGSDPLLPPIINSYYDEGGSWIFSSHDIPILIGAAAGAIGLILILLAAALIWQCCQFTVQREKSSYSLDNESERNSITSRNSNLYINNPIDSTIIIDEKSVVRENSDQNIKRSISAPIHKDRDNCPPPKTNTQNPIINSKELTLNNNNGFDDNSYINTNDDKLSQNHDSVSIGMELNEKQIDKNEINSQRSLMYVNHSLSADITALKSRSLPWSQSNKRRPLTVNDSEEFESKINFSKKRKNRMRNDSAAAIALNRSGTDSHKDTDTLVDNEAVVVYDERTAL